MFGFWDTEANASNVATSHIQYSSLDFVTNLNFGSRCSQIHTMLIATTAYVVSLVGIILMYIWYSPDPSCLINIFFITWTLVLLQLMTSVSLHPKVKYCLQRCLLVLSCLNVVCLLTSTWSKQVNAGILSPGLMGLYIVFICWFAIRRYGFTISSRCSWRMLWHCKLSLWSNYMIFVNNLS